MDLDPVVVFSHNDKAWRFWRSINPEGFVQNDTKIHRAWCQELDKNTNISTGDNPFTTAYKKFCSLMIESLHNLTPGLRLCKKCGGK